MEPSSGYTQFTYYTRLWLSTLLREGKSFREIGRIMGRHHTTISREVKRNSYNNYRLRLYNPTVAEEKANERKSKCRQGKIKVGKFIDKLIETLLKDSWSPDVIAGWLKSRGSCFAVSHETIYRHIYTQRRDLIRYLARQHRRRQWRGGKYKNRKKVLIPGRVFIEERPKEVESRHRFGHYEADTIISRESKVALLIVVERKTRIMRLKKINQKSAIHVRDGIIEILKKYKKSVKSITYDNGTENVYHEYINRKLQCSSYFCNPYHSWEKGSVENVIGLVRRFLPKKTDFAKITEEELRRIEKIINNRPRKLLKYETPRQVFRREWCNHV
jgi:IS30 family transposase